MYATAWRHGYRVFHYSIYVWDRKLKASLQDTIKSQFHSSLIKIISYRWSNQVWKVWFVMNDIFQLANFAFIVYHSIEINKITYVGLLQPYRISQIFISNYSHAFCVFQSINQSESSNGKNSIHCRSCWEVSESQRSTYDFHIRELCKYK